jgi:retinaldehyde-binding protein 1
VLDPLTITPYLRVFWADQDPKEFGGSLPSLFDLEDPLRPRQLTPSSVLDPVPPTNLLEFATVPHDGLVSRLSPTSALNPFYGYPVTPAPTGVPALRFGRRRKRDLIRTLAKLFWLRWHNEMNALLCLVGVVVLFRVVSRKGLFRLARTNPLSSIP